MRYCLLGSVAISILSFQIIRKVLPWIYENIIGPKFFGPKVNIKRLGSWAGMLEGDYCKKTY